MPRCEEDNVMVDRYTKIVLTIIAACLVWNVVAGLGQQKVMAQSGPVHVIVDQWGNYTATLPIPAKQQ
jgi:hypothetical protein